MAKNEITVDIKVKGGDTFKIASKEADKTAKSLNKVSKASDRLNKSQDNFNKQQKGVASAGANSTKNFSKMAQTMGGSSGLVAAYATLAANIFAITAAFGALKRAAAFEQLEAGLVRVGSAAGKNLPYIAESLRDITGAAISTKEAMTSVAIGTSAGFSTVQLEGLTKVAKGASLALGRDMSDAMSRLIRGAAKLEPEILDELGIMVRLDTATRGYADSIGKTTAQLTQFERRMAFTNKIIEEGVTKFGDVADSIDANPYDQLSATFEDLAQSGLEVFNVVLKPIAALLSSSPNALLGVLVMFSATIISKIVPSLNSMATAAAASAAGASRSWSVFVSNTNNELNTMQRKLSSLKFSSKSVRSLEADIKKGTVGVKELILAEKKLISTIAKRTKNIKARGTAQKKWDDITIRNKEKELKLLKQNLKEIRKIQDAKNVINKEAAVGGSAKAANFKRKAVGSRVTSMGLNKMEGQGIQDSFKTATKYSGLAFKSFQKTTGSLNTMKAAAQLTATSIKLFGSAFLTAIPIIGQVIAVGGMLYTAYSAIFSDETVSALDKTIEGFESFSDVSEQLAKTLWKLEDPSKIWLAELRAGIGIIDQIDAGLRGLNEIRLTNLNSEINKLTVKINNLRNDMEQGNSRYWGSFLMPDSTIDNLQTDELYSFLYDRQQLINEYNNPKVDKTAGLDAIAAAKKGINSQNNLLGTEALTEYYKALDILASKLKSGTMFQRDFNDALKTAKNPWAQILSSIDSAEDAYKSIEKATKVFSNKTKGPLDDVISSLTALSAEYNKVKDNANALKEFKSRIPEDSEFSLNIDDIDSTIRTFENFRNIISSTKTAAADIKVEMDKFKPTIKTNSNAAEEYYTLSNKYQNRLLAGINAEIAAGRRMGATKEYLTNLDNKRSAIVKKILDPEEQQKEINKAIVYEKLQIAKAITEQEKAILLVEKAEQKSIESTIKSLDANKKITASLSTQLNLQASLAKEASILNNNLSGTVGASNASAELAVFKEQQVAREALAQKEYDLKLQMIDLEFALLEQRLIVTNQEAVASAAKLAETDPAKGAALLDAIPDMSGYLKTMNEVRSISKDIAKEAFSLNGAKAFNKELSLLLDSSDELFTSLKSSAELLADPGISAAFSSVVTGIEEISDVMNSRALLAQTIADREVDIEKAKFARMAKLAKKDYKGAQQEDKKILRMKKESAADQLKLASSKGNAELSMAASVASGIGGVLEGLAATQDTTSKKGFESAKMMQMAAAVVNTAGAIMLAMATVPPPGNVVAAKVAAAMGAMQLATIASTSFEGGSKTAPKVSGGGAGSSTAGATGPRATSTKRDAGVTVADSISMESLRGLAEASDNASLAVNKVADGFLNLDGIFEDIGRTSVKHLDNTLEDILNGFKRKTKLGFTLDEGGEGLTQTRGSEGVGDKLLPAMESVMETIVRDIENAAIAIDKEINLDALDWSGDFWSTRMGGDSTKGRVEDYLQAYGNAVAATIDGLPDMKDWRFGDFEELMRLIDSLQSVNEAFSDVGITAISASLDGADVAGRLVETIGGIDNFTEAMELYSEVILTDVERLDLAVLNSTRRIDTQFAKINADIADSGVAGLDNYVISTPVDQTAFNQLFEDVAFWLEDEVYGGIANTVLVGLMESLPDFQEYWDSKLAQEEEVTAKLESRASLEIALLEESGYAHQALLLTRQQEIAELEDEEAAITRLIYAQEDLNKTRSLELQLMRLVGQETLATSIERERTLAGLSSGDAVVQSNIWQLEDAQAAVDDAQSIYETALANERTRLKAAAKAAEDTLKSLEDMLKRAFAREKEQVTADFEARLESLNNRLEASTERVSVLSSAFESLESASDSLTTMTKASFLAAVDGIREMNTAVRSGDLSGLEELDKFTSKISKDTQQFYATKADYMVDQAKAKVALDSLGGTVGDKLNYEERVVASLERQIVSTEAAKEAQLAALDLQLNTILGIHEEDMTLQEAIDAYQKREGSIALQTANAQLSALDSLVVYGEASAASTISVESALADLNAALASQDALKTGASDKFSGDFAGAEIDYSTAVTKEIGTWGAAALQFQTVEAKVRNDSANLLNIVTESILDATKLNGEEFLRYRNDYERYLVNKDATDTVAFSSINTELSTQNAKLTELVGELRKLRVENANSNNSSLSYSKSVKETIDKWDTQGMPGLDDTASAIRVDQI